MFSYVKTGTDMPVKVDCADSVYVTVKLNNPIPLPETVSAIYNDGSTAEVPVGEQTDFQVKATDAYSGETSLGMLTRWNFAWNSRSAACVMAATTSPCRLRAGMWVTTPSCTSMSAPTGNIMSRAFLSPAGVYGSSRK